MNDHQTKQAIQQALQTIERQGLKTGGLALLAAMGYHSDKRVPLSPNTPAEFISTFALDGKLSQQRALLNEWRSVDLLFQLTRDEIRSSGQPQLNFGLTNRLDNTIIESYLFLAVELAGGPYTRGQLARITREVNKPFQMPVMLLFRHGHHLTLSLINRRLHKRAESKDVLEKVTLIKDINLVQPHRAHVEILSDLALDHLYDKYGFTNFVGLHQAWQQTLDSSELNKRFFREVANWYFWAVKQVTFPPDAHPDPEIRTAAGVIRLITRLIFVWFLKEKGLVPDDLFNPGKLPDILKMGADPKGSTYYKAILQNLFFATLNQEMNTPKKPDNRKFRGKGSRRDQHYMIHNVYRYENYFKDPAAALQLFSTIPFLNGGLFECLDKEDRDNTKKKLRIDGFSDRADNPLAVPDDLFFGGEREVDLNEVYGASGKHYSVRGLIRILDSYKFTVDENTPIEEEIALDPELLGKVFENLLAAYNPETGVTARKQTGSFYTPREIVNYMVDESLIAYLEISLPSPPSALGGKGEQDSPPLEGEGPGVRSPLRRLLAYNDEPHPFSPAEVARLIEAIDAIKILDPAAGSGAFPMGILHKLVFILGKLDPHNERWKNRQIEKVRKAIEAAEAIDDSQIREATIAGLEQQIGDIEDTFNRNELDYGRKLYLIENCIYGVDIQPIAVQIAKLRFFISLVVDQKLDDSRPNRGLRPLPNLETKFVAANTLLGLDRPPQLAFKDPAIAAKEKQLEEVRRGHFTARTPATKDKYRQLDAQIRAEIGRLLRQSGFRADTTEKLAAWNPYDQNTGADFFDPEWMFGVTEGFDVVIGNPPYGLLNKRQNKAEAIVVKPEELEYYKTTSEYAPTASGMINIFRLFILKSINLLCDSGIFSEIFPLAFVADVSAAGLRKHILNNFTILCIEAFPERDNERKRVFEAAKMSVCILHLKKLRNIDRPFFVRIHHDRFVDVTDEKAYFNKQLISLLDKNNFTIPLMSQREVDLVVEVYQQSVTFSDVGHCYTGEIDLTLCKHYLTDNLNDAVLIKGAIIDRYLIRKSMSQGEIKFLNARKYLAETTGKKTTHFKSPRIVMQGITGVNERIRLKMTLIKENIFCANSVNYMVFHDRNINFEFALGVLNSSLMNFIFSKFSTNSNVNGYEVDNLPFPKFAPPQAQQPIISLVNQILAAKQANPSTNTSALEAEIDQWVYQLYGLTAEEIAIVEEAGR